jgi:dolichyl-phosphate-mannose-protein mannosyltransferase
LYPDHPSLGKLFIVTGILVFGDNPIGWRFFSVIFGTIIIFLFYMLLRRLNAAPVATWLATFLLALENLTFIQASVAMLDVYMLSFMLLAFWLYARRSYTLSGIAVGLSALAKISGALTLLPLVIHWLWTRKDKRIAFSRLVVLAPASFLILMPFTDFYIFRSLTNPVTRLLTMFDLTSSLTFASTDYSAASRPWEWVLKMETVTYWYEPHYVSAVSFTVWALLIPATIYMVYRAIKSDQAATFGLSWFIGVYLVWIPVSLITDRLSYLYYFYPAIGAFCLGLGLGLEKLIGVWSNSPRSLAGRVSLTGVILYLTAHAAVFLVLSPLT